jgi:hypothetical protein
MTNPTIQMSYEKQAKKITRKRDFSGEANLQRSRTKTQEPANASALPEVLREEQPARRAQD